MHRSREPNSDVRAAEADRRAPPPPATAADANETIPFAKDAPLIAGAVAARLRERNPSYAAMSDEEVRDAAELLLRGIVRGVRDGNPEALARHLERIAVLRADQDLAPSDVADAFVEVRRALTEAVGDSTSGASSRREMLDGLLETAALAERRLSERLHRS
jgi:hypothetical protein